MRRIPIGLRWGEEVAKRTGRRRHFVDPIELSDGRVIVTLDDAATFDDYRGLRIMRAVEGGKAVVGILDCEFVEAERALVPIGKSLPAIGGLGYSAL